MDTPILNLDQMDVEADWYGAIKQSLEGNLTHQSHISQVSRKHPHSPLSLLERQVTLKKIKVKYKS